jgi:hypothetical protein
MPRPFRPARTVTDPQGQQWELYVSRAAVPSWKEGGYDGLLDNASPADGAAILFEIPLAIVGFLWSCILLPLLRFLALTRIAILRGRRSKSARIEALCLYPEAETRTWITTLDQATSVLNQVALGLEEGKVVQPVGAFYAGSHPG